MPQAIEPFAEAETGYRTLVEAARRERITIRDFRAAVRSLMVEDGDGQDWVLGPNDGSWYVRDHDRWLPGTPTRRLVCPNCRHRNLTRHSYCVQCARALEELVLEQPD